MPNKSHNWLVKIVSCLLVVFLIIPSAVNATGTESIAPRASDYLTSYTSYICHMGGGELQIWYRVTGTGPDWADIGVLTIQLFESTDNINWQWVDTFRHTDYDTMLAHNTWQHMSHVDYQGKLGRYYIAYVTIWAGDADNNGDARNYWTDVEYASPLNP